MNPDLHCHSHNSDGQHSPEFLISRARENGITHLSITDHDVITWNEEASRQLTGIQLIPGVEISCQWESREIHVVGLFISPTQNELQELLYKQRQVRVRRFQTMDQKLREQDIYGLTDFLQALPSQTWTRSHVAGFLIDNGHCKNWQKAFTRFLSRKGKVYVPFECHSLETVVKAIVDANGIAVLAHPGRYGLSKSRLEKLFREFVALGGQALEGSYGNIDSATRKHLCQLAIAYDAYISVGSDFHDASRHWTDLGKLPALDTDSNKNAIWNHPRWHF